MSKKDHRKLAELYEAIPDFNCKEGCNDCCGCVPVANVEAENAGIKAGLTATKLGTMDCVHSTPNGCSIYDDRPFMCRLFGTTEKMKCPHGCKPDKMLNDKRAAKLTERYQSLKIPAIDVTGTITSLAKQA